MQQFNTIKWDYSKRTSRYKFLLPGVNTIFFALSKIFNKSYVSLLFKKRKDNYFEIDEFFLLELEYMLGHLLDSEHVTLVLANLKNTKDLLLFIRTHTWVADRYKEERYELNYDRIKHMMKFDILPSQRPAFEKYEHIKTFANLRGSLLDIATGGGKTFTSLALGEALDYDYMLVIAPSQVKENVWYDSVTKSLYKVPQSAVMLDKKFEYNGERFIIFHYEMLEKVVNNRKFLRLIKRLKPFLIIDEWHNFNEIKSKRTQKLIELVEYVDFDDIALLTGTPIKMDVKELKPMLYVLDRKFPKAVETFDKFYRSLSAFNLNLLRYRFDLYRERIEKDKSKLPPITIEEVRISIPNGDDYTIDAINEKIAEYKKKRLEELKEHFNEYEKEFKELIYKAINKINDSDIREELETYFKYVNEIREASEKGHIRYVVSKLEFCREFEENYIYPNLTQEEIKRFKHIAPIVKYPKLKVLGEALGRVLLRTRINCYKDLAKYVDYRNLLAITDKKGIVFSEYTAVCDSAIKKLEQQGFKPLYVYGDKTKELDKIVKLFMDTKNDYNPLVTTYKSLSTGVPLIAANVVICLGLPFRMYTFDQAIARAYRIGQDKKVYVFIVKLDTGAKVNITERDLYILNVSQAKVEVITGNKFDYEVPLERLGSDREEEDEDTESKLIKEELADIMIETTGNKLMDMILGFLRKIKIQ